MGTFFLWLFAIIGIFAVLPLVVLVLVCLAGWVMPNKTRM